MPTIQGPITFKAGKEVPEKFKESMKEANVKMPFKEVKEKGKKTKNKKAKKKSKPKKVKKKGVKK